MRTLGCKSVRQEWTLFFTGHPGCSEAKTVLEPVLISRTTFLQHSVPKLAGCFEILRVIHREEGLKWCISSLTPRPALLARRRIKSDHGRRWRRAFPK